MSGLEIWIPESARDAFHCRICGEGFGRDKRPQWSRHVVACAKENGGRFEVKHQERRENPFTGVLDPELYAHVRRGGK